ncbi:hypothetical protein FD755_005085 [Muntiacus reevesi]|uniref:Anthrax toxin receptor extracellular domain-containing protein n=1 Tax=Muntiacus reevesi TaxID=9886 RepID=A0A5J5MS11_MUNRE|nr:hypothetical protein FD755_005085 [Muntiacus reevesi]
MIISVEKQLDTVQVQHHNRSNLIKTSMQIITDALSSMGGSLHQCGEDPVQSNFSVQQPFYDHIPKTHTAEAAADLLPPGLCSGHKGLRRENEQWSLIFLCVTGPDSILLSQDCFNYWIQENMQTFLHGLQSQGRRRTDPQVSESPSGTQAYVLSSDQEVPRNSVKGVTYYNFMDIVFAESYQLGFYARGLNPDKIKDYTCRYKLDDSQVYNKEPASVTNEKITCQGHIFAKTGQVIVVDYSLDLGKTYSKQFLKVTSKDCVEPPGPTVPLAPTEDPVPSNLLLLLPLVPFLAMIPLLLLCIWCYRRISKEPTPVPKPVSNKPFPAQTRVIVSCGGYQEDALREMEGKVDTLCDFVQRCNQMPLMWCPPRNMHRCISLSLPEPHCGQMPCGSNICFQPSQESFLLNNCCSRCHHPPPVCSQPPSSMLPLIPPTAEEFYRPSSSLPPP